MKLESEVHLIRINQEQKELLKNLVSLYLHDLSEFADDLYINESGMFEYDGIDLFNTKEGLDSFFIIYNENIVGFILFCSGKYVSEGVQYSVHELFTLKGFRGKGIATKAILELFKLYKGTYKITQLQSNNLAINFWRNFYKKHEISYHEEQEEMDDLLCYTQVFDV